MQLDSFEDLIQHQVQDLFSAEQQFAEAMPELSEAATHPDLAAALETHLDVTHEQIERLRRIARALGVREQGDECAAARGLVEEAREVVETDGDAMVKDAALIAAAQRIEHYEIAGYGTLKALAKRIGNTEAARLADESLAEERGADLQLTEIAEDQVNKEAAS
jgi:ferritin-like metal-binding protein YciE